MRAKVAGVRGRYPRYRGILSSNGLTCYAGKRTVSMHMVEQKDRDAVVEPDSGMSCGNRDTLDFLEDL